MPAFDTHSREQLRRSYVEAWSRHLSGAPLTPLQALIADVIGAHPEYQLIMRNADAAIAFEQAAGGDTENPFLHMGLHIAVREQLAIDRPPGIRALHSQLQARYGDIHAAEHHLMEALGQTLWQAQRDGRAPDESQYLALARAPLIQG
jgi:Domain of unknown function (DUF1841)